jgi:hypothetical protein
MTINSEIDEEAQAEWKYVHEQAPTWLVNGLGSKELWEKLSDYTLAELHNALRLHLGDANFALLFEFALAVTAKRPALLQMIADDLRS